MKKTLDPKEIIKELEDMGKNTDNSTELIDTALFSQREIEIIKTILNDKVTQ